MYPTTTTDPSQDSDRRYYECRGCGERTLASEFRSSCPACGGRLRNIAVARE